jgi:hypothetical protein
MPKYAQSTERRGPDPDPTFSLAALARSWAEISEEAWENVLYRLGDWAITDAFPDDAFLTSGAGDTTFHKKVIFDRVRWHRELVDKIRGVQDPKEKARLQQFADIHLQVAEVAVLRLDVVMEACRAMDVAPPPILGFVVGVSAKHRVPPECPPDFAVGVYAREAERDQAGRHRGEVMAPDEADKYTLLWDAAREMSRNNERDVEWNWLKLLDAFWRGDLAPDGLMYFYPALPAGREFVVYDRAALAGLLLGPRALETGAASIDDLRHWRVSDYRDQPAPFGDYFEHDPEGRLGFAVLTQELDRRRLAASGTANPVTTPSGDKRIGDASRRRGAYRGALDSWMAKQDLPILQKMGPAGIAGEFKSYCDEELPKLITLLPKRIRSMEGEIERIIKRRVDVTRARNRRPKSE